MKPINPSEAEGKKLSSIEPEIIQAVNELIVENLKSGTADILQDEILERYFKIKGTKNTAASRGKLFDANQLDFEPIFRKAGWAVEYDKPGYCETYPASFKFKKKKK